MCYNIERVNNATYFSFDFFGECRMHMISQFCVRLKWYRILTRFTLIDFLVH